MNLIDNNSFKQLNFQELLNRVAPLSPYGKKLLGELSPYVKGQEELLFLEFQRLDKIQQFTVNYDSLVSLIEHDLSCFKNITMLLNKCLHGHIVDEVDCFEIKEHIFLMQQIQKKIANNPVFKDFYLEPLDDAYALLDPNDEKVLTFHFYNSYSPELEKTRKEKQKIEESIFCEKDIHRKNLLLQQRTEIIVREEKAEYEVRCQIMAGLQPFVPSLLKNIDKIASLDFSLAKVRFFHRHNCILPNISKTPLIYAKNMINIRVKEALKGKRLHYTPIDISVVSGTTVITGANMGGKSVALRTIAENVLLFHYGFFTPCEEASFSLMEFVQFIFDDMQDFSRGLSSFGSEILKLKGIYHLLQAEKQGLIIFDEFARGTNPQEGQRFVRALVAYLNRFPSISIITSHFDDILTDGVTHYQVVGLKNINLEQLKRKISGHYTSLKTIQEYMDYKLEKTDNIRVPRDALHIAQLIGIAPELEQIIQKEYKEELGDEQ